MVKNPPANAGDVGSIPGSGRFPGEGNGNPFQCSCLGKIETPDWLHNLWSCRESDMTEGLSMHMINITAKHTYLLYCIYSHINI